MSEIELTKEFDSNGSVTVSLSSIEVYIFKITYSFFNNFIKYTKLNGFFNGVVMLFFALFHWLATIAVLFFTRRIKGVVLFYQMNTSKIESVSMYSENNQKILVFKKKRKK